MKRRGMAGLILLVTAAFLLPGCTAYVHPSDVQARFSALLEGAQRAQQDYQAKKDLYDRAVALSGQPDLNPYPDMRQLLDEMSPLIRQIGDKAQRLQGFKRNFDALFAGRQVISSKDPDWDRFRTVSIEFQQEEQPLNDLWGQYNKEASAFQQDVDNFMIGPMALDDALARLHHFSDFMNKGLEDLAGQVQDAEGQVALFKQQDLGYDFVANKVELLGEMRATVRDLYSMKHDLEPRVESLGESLDQDRPRDVWVGPGIPRTDVLPELRDAQAQIGRDEARLKDLQRRFYPPKPKQDQGQDQGHGHDQGQDQGH